MGKKNRSRNKKSKNPHNTQNNQNLPSPTESLNPFTLKSSQSFKEDFIIKIKQVCSKLLAEFEEFSTIRMQSKANFQIRFNRTDIFKSLSDFDIKNDPSNECLEIFFKIFHRFLDSLLKNLKEIFREQPEKCFISMQDALQLIETFTLDLSGFAFEVFSMNEAAFRGFCLGLFREKVKKDLELEKVLRRVWEGKDLDVRTDLWEKIKKGQGESEDLKMDLLVENFQRTLDLHIQIGFRSKPYCSDEWIERIKKLLGSPRGDLEYI